MTRKVYVIGVGMTPFLKPSVDGPDFPDLAKDAGTQALEDAGISYGEIQQVVCGYVYGDSTCGQRAVYGLGLSGVPIYNVNNNCSTGASALMLAKQLVEGGSAECAMALGFERMKKGSIQLGDPDRTNPLDKHLQTMARQHGVAQAPPAPQLFGNAALEHMERYGSTAEQFASVAMKNHAHSELNERAQFRDVYTLQEILDSRPVHGPITKLQCCPTSDGAAAAIVASDDFVRTHGLLEQSIEILAMTMATDMESTFGDSAMALIGTDMAKKAAADCYAASGLTPTEVDVIELHDCFSANELLTYEALGLCDTGQGGALVEDGQVTYGGQWVVNPSGGLISKGHPLGATGIAQCAELTWQLRGLCGPRQVQGAEVALQHNLGLGGACVIAAYARG